MFEIVITSLIVSIGYTIVAMLLFVGGYRAIEKSAPQRMTQYCLLATVVRMLSAIMVALVFLMLTSDTTVRKVFAITFLICYLAMLIFDVAFLIKAQHKNNK